MGALLSLPLLAVPSVTTLVSFAASCCGAATCSMVCSACGKCGNSVATRIGYALILLINSILAWIMETPWAIKKLEGLMLDYVKINCPTGQCYGWLAVHRINFALGLFHLIFAGLLIGVSSSKQPRAALQNGYWGPKIIAWIAFIVLSFLIPDEFFVFWGNYISLFGAMLFLILGLILLVDMAHSWAEYCLEQIENSESRVWRVVLIGSTLGMYIGSIVMTVLQYVFFGKGGCSMNQAVVTINLILLLVVSAVSVHPSVQEYNPKAGLAQAAMVAVYCTYLTMSAVSMKPDNSEDKHYISLFGGRTSGDDERSSTQYNYTTFHIIFFLATTWVATLLTMNYEDSTRDGDFATVGRTYWATWVKIISSWVCYVLYIWTLVAPVVLPERF